MKGRQGKNRVLVLGSASLVGSHFAATWREGSIEAAGRSDPRSQGFVVARFTHANLNDEAGARKLVQGTECKFVVNYAAETDVEGCEKERPQDSASPLGSGSGSAWTINAELPGWLAEECAKRGIFLVHVSTDFVFDGSAGPYSEESKPSPFSERIGWYGYTKGVGEARVLSALGTSSAAIVRIAYPYRAHFPGKLDFARNLLKRQSEGKLYPLYTDQVITPTWIPDVTETIGQILASRASGTYHVASPTSTTPFEFARALFEEFGYDPDLVSPSRLSGSDPAGRAPRPLRGGLRVRNALKLGVHPVDYRVGVRLLAEETHADSLQTTG